ncbi:dethiobiotin synthase [Kaarinaea lacus]
MSGYFITSTDTNVGKTTVSLSLMRHFKARGKIVACMKPVSAGCSVTTDGLRNDDAVQLIRESSIDLPYELVNPYAFEPAIAPHLAALQINRIIELQSIRNNFMQIEAMANAVIVEGAGGWLVPVNESQTMADVAKVLQLPIILVVGMRLGCLNHALLSIRSIVESGLPCTGWVANYIDRDMQKQKENLETLKSMMPVPLIATVAYNENPANRELNFVSEI